MGSWSLKQRKSALCRSLIDFSSVFFGLNVKVKPVSDGLRCNPVLVNVGNYAPQVNNRQCMETFFIITVGSEILLTNSG